MADYIRNNTPKDAKLLTNDSFYHFVYSLTGRDIYLGPSNFVSTHGLTTDEERARMSGELRSAYSGSYEELLRFCEENGIDYVYVGNAERRDLSVNENTLARLTKVHQEGSETLYKVK